MNTKFEKAISELHSREIAVAFLFYFMWKKHRMNVFNLSILHDVLPVFLDNLEKQGYRFDFNYDSASKRYRELDRTVAKMMGAGILQMQSDQKADIQEFKNPDAGSRLLDIYGRSTAPLLIADEAKSLHQAAQHLVEAYEAMLPHYPAPQTSRKMEGV